MVRSTEGAWHRKWKLGGLRKLLRWWVEVDREIERHRPQFPWSFDLRTASWRTSGLVARMGPVDNRMPDRASGGGGRDQAMDGRRWMDWKSDLVEGGWGSKGGSRDSGHRRCWGLGFA